MLAMYKYGLKGVVIYLHFIQYCNFTQIDMEKVLYSSVQARLSTLEGVEVMYLHLYILCTILTPFSSLSFSCFPPHGIFLSSWHTLSTSVSLSHHSNRTFKTCCLLHYLPHPSHHMAILPHPFIPLSTSFCLSSSQYLDIHTPCSLFSFLPVLSIFFPSFQFPSYSSSFLPILPIPFSPVPLIPFSSVKMSS